MLSRAIFSRCAGLPPAGHATTTSGRSATSRSMSTAATSPMRARRRAAGGSSEYSTVAITSPPAPAANSISVAPGVRLTMRSGGSRTVTWRLKSSETVCAANAGPPAPSPRHSVSAWTASDLIAVDKRVVSVPRTDRQAHRPRTRRARPSGRNRLAHALPAHALQRPRHGMHRGGDAHRALHRLARSPVLAQLPFVRSDAGSAAVDRRYREGQELEIRLGDAGTADDVHAQARRKLRVLRILHQVQEAVVDVVHGHDGGGGVRRAHVRGVQMSRGEGLKSQAEGGVARGGSRGERHRPDLPLRQAGSTRGREYRAEVQLQIARVARQRLANAFQSVHLRPP